MRVAKTVVVVGTLLLGALALGTSLAMAQQGQAIPKTKGPKPAPVAAPAAAGAGVGQVDESSWAQGETVPSLLWQGAWLVLLRTFLKLRFWALCVCAGGTHLKASSVVL